MSSVLTRTVAEVTQFDVLETCTQLLRHFSNSSMFTKNDLQSTLLFGLCRMIGVIVTWYFYRWKSRTFSEEDIDL